MKRIDQNSTITKVCYVCGFVGSEELFMVKANMCTKCAYEYKRKDYAENKEHWRVRHRKYTKTPAGKVSIHKSGSKRRRLGHEPINSWFSCSDAHHLRYSTNSDKQDNDIVIYAPMDLHKSIWHNGVTGQGMREINILLLEWYLSTTPIEIRNKKAVDLYLKYCLLPEPVWINNLAPSN